MYRPVYRPVYVPFIDLFIDSCIYAVIHSLRGLTACFVPGIDEQLLSGKEASRNQDGIQEQPEQGGLGVINRDAR